MPIVGIATACGQLARDALGGALDDQRKRAGFGDRDPVAHYLVALGVGVAARAVAAERVDRLRRQPDMAHHRNAATHEKRDRLGHFLAAFELDRGAAGLGQHARGGAERLLRAIPDRSRTADRP